MFKLFVLLFIPIFLFAKNFTVASYNVENFFDLKKDRSDYYEYIPNSKSNWNKKSFDVKMNNLIRVIKDINADIIALQEIENKDLMTLLLKKLPDYRYYSFSKYENSSVGVGFLSKIKIASNKDINVKFTNKIFRPILETTFEIENIEFKIFNNHWPSKKVAESYRVKYAKTLFDRIKELPLDYDYILLGDFNSNYNEYETLFSERNLNNTNGITGINQVLNTTINKNFLTYEDIKTREDRVHYNLWLDLSYNERFSNKYRGKNTTPDNIILSRALFDNKKISYVLKSFKTFKPDYLYKNGNIVRWEIKNKVHQSFGFSDHLPIMAIFSTEGKDKNPLKEIPKKELSKISQLYNKTKLIENIYIDNIVVIYKNENNAIIKQKNDRAIYLYKNAQELKEGYSYDIKVSKIKDFNGLKEIEEFEIEREVGKIKDYETMYLNSNTNVFDLNLQNEIVKNLKGFYKNGYLYFDNHKRIKVYAPNKNDLPNENKEIIIPKAHIAYYNSFPQILIHEKIK